MLSLTIFESRPLCTGAALAARLHEVALASREKAEQLRGLATSYENPWRAHPLAAGPDAGADGGLRQRVLHELGAAKREGNGALVASVGESYGTLDSLLARAEDGLFGRPPPTGLGGARVQIRAATDNAAASVLSGVKSRGEGQAVVLLGVEAVLPGKGGDVRAPLGSWLLAETAKKLGAKVPASSSPASTLHHCLAEPLTIGAATLWQVFVVAMSDHILSSRPATTAAAQHDPTELLAGWSGTLAEELVSLDAFALAAADPRQPDVSVFCQTSEVVPGRLIDGYISACAHHPCRLW